MSLKTELRDFISSVVSFPQDYLNGFGLPPSESGAIVNEMSAMQISTYFACIRIISDAVGTLPLNVYERMPDGSETVCWNHPLQRLLHTQPNPEVSAADLRQCMQSHILLTGNAYAEIIYTAGGQIDSYYVRSPFQTFPYRNLQGQLIYKTHDDPSGAERTIDAEHMFHVKGMGIDSLVGLSPVKYYAREILGVEISAQSYSANFFKNQATPTGYLSSPSANMKPTQKLSALNSWMQAHGRGNAHTPAVLEAGWKWESTGVNPEDSQLIELRGMNRDQISSIFGVPPHMCGGVEDTKANIEQKALEFLTFTLRPWLKRWEMAINMKAFPTIGRNANRFHCKFDTTELEQPDFKTKIQGLQMARYAGLITAQEGRKTLGYNPYEDKQLTSDNPADKLWQPVNMIAITPESIANPPAAMPGTDTESEPEAKPEAPKDNNSVIEKNSIDQEILHYFRTFGYAFNDAFNRIQARNKPNEHDFQRTFGPILSTIAASFAFDANATDPTINPVSEQLSVAIQDYISGMAIRAAQWKPETSAIELRRAITYIRSKTEHVKRNLVSDKCSLCIGETNV
jgi:HK97 family phage portal protein